MMRLFMLATWLAVFSAHAQLAVVALSNSTENVSVSAGKVFRLKSGYSDGSGRLSFSIGGQSATVKPLITTVGGMAEYRALEVPGPCDVAMTAYSEMLYVPSPIGSYAETSGQAIFIYEVADAQPLPVPGTGVVIPEDGEGPVKVVMESSADLVTWTEALPGTYGRTERKRFFRLRLSNQ